MKQTKQKQNKEAPRPWRQLYAGEMVLTSRASKACLLCLSARVNLTVMRCLTLSGVPDLESRIGHNIRLQATNQPPKSAPQ